MRRQISFQLTDTDKFLILTKKYFTIMGFKIVSESKNQLTFAKGSSLLNMVTINPLNWKSEVKVVLSDEIVKADFNINTFGQMVSPKEERLWDTFMENYKISLSHGVNMIQLNKHQVSDTKKYNWKYVRYAMIGAIVFGIPSGFLAYYTGLDTLAPIGASIGAVSFLMNKIGKDKAKTIR